MHQKESWSYLERGSWITEPKGQPITPHRKEGRLRFREIRYIHPTALDRDVKVRNRGFNL
jgi:hypothetical protein